MSEIFTLRKDSIEYKEVTCKLYIFRCPLCDRVITSHYYNKLLASAKLHIRRVHKLKVVEE